jgi:hypothetical protein
MGVYHARGAARFVTPAADLPPDNPLKTWQTSRVTALDVQLAEIAVVPAILWRPSDRYRLDRLLDLRNKVRPPMPLPDDYPARPLRPSVPVIPGRPS